MSRIAERPAVAPFDPFKNTSTGVGNSVYGAFPANGAQPSSGSGSFDSGLLTMIGQRFDTRDGRELVLVSNGAAAMAAGKVYQAAAQITGHQLLAMTVPAATPATAGLFQILVTNGATVIKQNYYAGGYAIVGGGTGAGQILRISSHPGAATSATCLITLADPIQTTLDATSTITLVKNQYDSVILNVHTSFSSGPVGVALNPIPASTAPTWDGTSGALTANGVYQYGFLVTRGQTAALIDSTTTVGYGLGTSVNVDGALEVQTLTSSPMVAISMQTQTDAKYGFVNVLL